MELSHPRSPGVRTTIEKPGSADESIRLALTQESVRDEVALVDASPDEPEAVLGFRALVGANRWTNHEVISLATLLAVDLATISRPLGAWMSGFLGTGAPLRITRDIERRFAGPGRGIL